MSTDRLCVPRKGRHFGRYRIRGAPGGSHGLASVVKFLVDNQLPAALARFLAARGVACVHVLDIYWTAGWRMPVTVPSGIMPLATTTS